MFVTVQAAVPPAPCARLRGAGPARDSTSTHGVIFITFNMCYVTCLNCAGSCTTCATRATMRSWACPWELARWTSRRHTSESCWSFCCGLLLSYLSACIVHELSSASQACLPLEASKMAPRRHTDVCGSKSTTGERPAMLAVRCSQQLCSAQLRLKGRRSCPGGLFLAALFTALPLDHAAGDCCTYHMLTAVPNP